MHIVSRKEMQAVDHYTIEQIGLQGPLLMENAGRAFFAEFVQELGKDERIVVVIGKGNNGGDGFAVARHLLDTPHELQVWVMPEQAEITGDAAYHLHAFLQAGGEIRVVGSAPAQFAESIERATWIIDALLGTGIHGEPYPSYIEVIRRINRAPGRVAAVDLPSGVPADGIPFTHEAVKADITYTLQCPKLATYTQPAAECFGECHVVDIGIPDAAIKRQGFKRKVRTAADVIRTLPRRDSFSHKGSYGKGLLIAGSETLPGAAFFSAKAALRSGIGLLTLSVPDSVRPVIAARLPETMHMQRQALDYRHMTGIAIGPGLGREEEKAALVRSVLEYDQVPCVIDADGLFHLKNYLGLLNERKSPVVLTPHPGEMARLLDVSIKDVESDRFGVSKAFAEKYQVYLVLKGRHTIVTAPDGRQTVNPTGNPALAKGGSGDVLTGIVFAFILQHEQIFDAICNAVYLHGAVADKLVRTAHSMLDVLASDVIDHIPAVLFDLYRDATC